MTVKKKCNKGKQSYQKRGHMDKEMMYWCDFCLFKVGFNQLINKLSFMRNRCFVLAVSRILRRIGFSDINGIFNS